MSESFERAVIGEVTKLALKNVDVDAMAKRMQAKIEKKLEEGIMRWIDDDFYVGGCLEDHDVQEALEGHIKGLFFKALNIQPPKPVVKPTPRKRARK